MMECEVIGLGLRNLVLRSGVDTSSERIAQRLLVITGSLMCWHGRGFMVEGEGDYDLHMFRMWYSPVGKRSRLPVGGSALPFQVTAIEGELSTSPSRQLRD